MNDSVKIQSKSKVVSYAGGLSGICRVINYLADEKIIDKSDPVISIKNIEGCKFDLANIKLFVYL
jgi:hypothetical protein